MPSGGDPVLRLKKRFVPLNDKPLTRHGLKAGIRRGLTVEEIARLREMTVARVCLALERFDMDYYQLRESKTFWRNAG